MVLNYQNVHSVISKLEISARRLNTEIDTIIAGYRTETDQEDKSYNRSKANAKKSYEEEKKSLTDRTYQMKSDAEKIYNTVVQMDNVLTSKDKYYKKTKQKKEAELQQSLSDKFDEDADYFEVIDNIKSSFEIIFKKYNDNMLPSIINGLHYFFSSKRKEDYEELIVLKNTVRVFLDEISQNLDTILEDLLKDLYTEYLDKLNEIEKNHASRMTFLDKKMDRGIEQVSDKIISELEKVLPESLVKEMYQKMNQYIYSLERVSEKPVFEDTALSMFCFYKDIHQMHVDDILGDEIRNQLSALNILEDEKNVICFPWGVYCSNNADFYIEWDSENREFVQDFVHSIMYSVLTQAPVGKLKFTIIDSVSRGMSIRPFFDAKNKAPELFDSVIYHQQSDVEKKLLQINDEIDYFSQNILGTRYANVFMLPDESEWNHVLNFLVIFDFPKGMNDGSLELLYNIVSQGNKCGWYVIIAETFDDFVEHHSKMYDKYLTNIKSSCNYFLAKEDNIYYVPRGSVEAADAVLTVPLMQMPAKNAFSVYFEKYVLNLERIHNKGIAFPEMLRNLFMSKDESDVEKSIEYITNYQIQQGSGNYYCFDLDPETNEPVQIMTDQIGLGTVTYPLSVFEDSAAYDHIKRLFSNHSNFASMPFSVTLDKSVNILLIAEDRNYYKAVEYANSIFHAFLSDLPAGGLTANIADLEARGRNVVQFLDLSVKCPAIFEGGIISSGERFHKKIKELVNRCDKIIQSKLGSKYESIADYNRDNPVNFEPYTFLLIFGYPDGIDDVTLTDIEWLVKNGGRCGVVIVIVKKKQDSILLDQLFETKDIRQIHEHCTTLVSEGDEFRMYPYSVKLSPRKHPLPLSQFLLKYEDRYQQVQEMRKSVAPDNDYSKWFGLTETPVYSKGNKVLRLPYGINTDGEICHCSFENENFAAFLCGSAGSGKSTLIHSLITGIIRNYHPDDVELWLADFKMQEFRRYTKNTPPHIKYILLEESPDAVYDFLDRLNSEMMRRQNLGAGTNLAKLPVDIYMPIIFVIIDEFSIMSQIIDKDYDYQLKLQNLLAKGRALGFRFLFASQTFTSGVSGLTTPAKQQIQMRLVMKCPPDEISETIDMSKSLMTDEQRQWLLTLAPHHVLMKKRIEEGDLVSDEERRKEIILTLAKALFFPSDDIQTDFIKMINSKFHPEDKYFPGQEWSYLNKHPVIVDGSIYSSFLEAWPALNRCRKIFESGNECRDDSKMIFLGSPRSMDEARGIIIEDEFEENVLLFGSKTDQVTSIILSSIKSLMVINVDTYFIGYNRNVITSKIQSEFTDVISPICDERDICTLIRSLRQKIDEYVQMNCVVFIAGLDSIVKNISHMAEGSDRRTSYKKARQNQSFEDDMMFSDMEEFVLDTGPKSFPSIQEQLKLANEKVFGSDGIVPGLSVENTTVQHEDRHSSSLDLLDSPVDSVDEDLPDIYDISEDLRIIMRDGPRCGCHLFIVFRTLGETKQAHVNTDLFKHRITFQCSKEDSFNIVGSGAAYDLGGTAFIYSNGTESFSMRPYLHKNLEWDNWTADENEASMMISD